MKKTVKKKKIILKKWTKFLIVSLLAVTAFVAIFLIVKGVVPKNNQIPVYTYNMKRAIDYKVFLHKNSFYEEEFIGMGKQYTTELIDYIDIDFDYQYNGSKLTDISYNYNIKADIIGEYENSDNGNSELWTKKYVLLNTQEKKVDDTTSFNVKERLKIDYNKYNEIVKNFKKEFRLAIDAYLKIRLNIEYSGKIEGYEDVINEKDYLEIYIPLSKATINIDTNYTEDNSKTIIPKLNEENDKVLLYAGIVLFILDIIVFSLVYNKIFVSNKTLYSKKLERILKEYSEIIVESSTMLNYDDLEVLDITNFDDMVDIEEEVKSPIIFYENIKGEESWFIVLKGKYAYRYILSSEEI